MADSVAADAAAMRREARRQKILARSGERINKIMGVSTENTPSAPEPKPRTFEMNALFSTDSSTSQLQKLHELNRAQEALVDARQPSETVFPSELTAEGQQDSVTTTPSQSQAGLPPQLANLLQNLQQSQDPTLTEDNQEVTEADNRNFCRIRTILCFLIGILIRLSLLSTFGTLYVQSALNPFVAFEIAVIGYQRAVGMALQEKMKGGMWMTALTLSGVNQDVINTYTRIMGIMTRIMDDFTVYFFAFTITHLFVW